MRYELEGDRDTFRYVRPCHVEEAHVFGAPVREVNDRPNEKSQRISGQGDFSCSFQSVFKGRRSGFELPYHVVGVDAESHFSFAVMLEFK